MDKIFTNAISLLIKYRTSLTSRWNYKPIDNLPAWINSIGWDIVIIDAPEGHVIETPGRISSI